MSASPAPWRIAPSRRPYQAHYQIEDAVGLCVVALEESPLHDAAANARLIAAAPELLSELQALRAVCLAAISSGDWMVDGACDPDAELRRSAAAIAKATGEQA